MHFVVEDAKQKGEFMKKNILGLLSVIVMGGLIVTPSVQAAVAAVASTDVNARDHRGRTALMLASRNGKIELVKLLIKKGADVNLQDNQNKTALIWVCNNGIVEIDGSIEIARFLIENGADVSLQDISGRSALIAAARNRSIELVNLLIEKGADVNARDKGGVTALEYASSRSMLPSNLEIIDLLKKAQSAQEIACLQGHAGNWIRLANQPE